MTVDLNLNHQAPRPATKHYRIGVVGAGFIMRDVQLVAYRNAGYNVTAIAARRVPQAREVAQLRGIPKVYEDWRELVADPSIEVLDIAVPPHAQAEVLLEAARYSAHFSGVLAQKPLALNYRQAKATVDACERAGLKLAVNQNMRYDQSIRALKTLLDRGYLGEPVLATIEMRAIPHWMPWARQYDRLTLLDHEHPSPGRASAICSATRRASTSARAPIRAPQFPHRDGIVLYILEYANGMRASAWDDVWAGPAREGAAPRHLHQVARRGHRRPGAGHDRLAGLSERGAEHDPVHHQSTARLLDLAQVEGSRGFRMPSRARWASCCQSITENRAPAISGRDNLKTMALVEAGYRSLDEHRPVRPADIIKEEQA